MTLKEYINECYFGHPPDSVMPGVYVLGFMAGADDFEPSYVGRGDDDVLARAKFGLAMRREEGHRRQVSHWCFRVFASAEEAYEEECQIYNALLSSDFCLNRAHPTPPGKSGA